MIGSVEYCEDALDLFAKYDWTDEFIESIRETPGDNYALELKFFIENYAYKLYFFLKNRGSYNVERLWFGTRINMYFKIGVREATDDDFMVNQISRFSDKEFKKLWVSHNEMFNNFFAVYVASKKKINFRVLNEFRASNIIKKKNMPNIDLSQFEMVRFQGQILYKLDDAELALILLSQS